MNWEDPVLLTLLILAGGCLAFCGLSALADWLDRRSRPGRLDHLAGLRPSDLEIPPGERVLRLVPGKEVDGE